MTTPASCISPSNEGRKQEVTTPIANTLNHLRLCQRARATGYPVSYTTDAAWLVHMAINRRAGWKDDPSEIRGSAMPVNGKYPRKASGMRYVHLEHLAREINSRAVVRLGQLGEWRKLILLRVPQRIWEGE